MLSVIIRTKNGEGVLLDSLRPLIGAAAEGIVRDVVFLDTGSNDGTPQIADAAGATFLRPSETDLRATQEALAIAKRGQWVMLLDQATVLTPGWMNETVSFIERQERVKSSRGRLSAVFRPEHEPEAGSSDVRRRAAILIANRLFSRARLSQGIMVRRGDLEPIKTAQWGVADPAFHLPNLLRLRSRTYLAQPMPELADVGPASLADGNLARAAP